MKQVHLIKVIVVSAVLTCFSCSGEPVLKDSASISKVMTSIVLSHDLKLLSKIVSPKYDLQVNRINMHVDSPKYVWREQSSSSHDWQFWGCMKFSSKEIYKIAEKSVNQVSISASEVSFLDTLEDYLFNFKDFFYLGKPFIRKSKKIKQFITNESFLRNVKLKDDSEYLQFTFGSPDIPATTHFIFHKDKNGRYWLFSM